MSGPPKCEVRPLTRSEVENLEGQHDLILQKMAALDDIYYQLGGALAEAEAALSERRIEAERARSEVEKLKHLKSITTERARNLKAIIGRM